MGVPGSADLMLIGQQGYRISRSLRFNSADSAYLNRTPGAGGGITKGVISAWIKRSGLGTSQSIIQARQDASNQQYIGFTTNDTIEVGITAAGTNTLYKVTSAVYRDCSAWYHIFFYQDNTLATAEDRYQLYVNGVRVTAWGTNINTAPQSTSTYFGTSNPHYIGAYNAVGGYYSGYITEYHFIYQPTTVPTVSDFGETDTITGVWKPKRYSGTYGTNGFYLSFKNNSNVSSLGQDQAYVDGIKPENNFWTTNNFSVTAGAGNDSMIDTPTPYADGGNGRGNYCTLNPLDIYAGSLSNGNLEFSGLYSSQNGIGCRGTLAVPSSGKWYAEAAAVLILGVGNSCMLGFTSSNQSISATAFGATLTPWLGVDASINGNGLRLIWNGVSGGTASSTTLFATYASGDVVNFAIDFDNGKLWIGKNGTWYNSGNPAAGTNATTTFTAGTSPWRFWAEYVASADNSNRSGVISNFGQRAFAYTPPSGFLALNTQNLPDPTIKKPGTYMDVKTWTATGTDPLVVSGLGFSPDLVWAKARSDSYNHVLVDSVRGVNNVLSSNLTNAEASYTTVTQFNSDGFNAGGTTNNNYSLNCTVTAARTYVAWCWDAGTSATNTAGTITSTVSANASAGFSIVSYTGTISGSAPTPLPTVGHGLGVAPQLVIGKSRNNGGVESGNWFVWHAAAGTGNWLRLNTTDAAGSISGAGGGTMVAPTSAVFSTPYISGSNISGAIYVAYCFSEVAGFSKFGSYTGNGSSDGPFVYCGFRPRWVMIKRTDSAANWQIYDTSRDANNQMFRELVPNSSAEENSVSLNIGVALDALSNGFKLRDPDTAGNASGGTYVFAAFSDSAFKYSLAR